MPSSQGIRAGRAYVELGVGDKLTAGLRRAQVRLRAFAAGVDRIGMGMLRTGAMMAAPLAIGAKVFADFQQQMANVSTMLDEPAKHMPEFTEALRRMSVEFGESTEALAGGLYDILSASIPAGKALAVLETATRAAKAGMTDTKTAADALTTILNAYGLSADRAGDVSDLLFQVVKRGKTTFAELAPSIGMVASTAAAAGLSLPELGGALATLTRNGVRTENAVAAVNATVAAFLKPSDEAAAYAAELGFNMSTATLRAEGLEGVFRRIGQLPPDAIARLFPKIRALRGVIPAIQNLKGFREDIAAMGRSAGSTSTAYEKMTKTLTHAFNQVKQAGILALSRLGETLADGLTVAAKAIRLIADAAGEWIAKNGDLARTIGAVAVAVIAGGAAMLFVGAVIKVVAFALGGLSMAFGLAAVAAKLLGAVLAIILSPIGLVAAAVVGLGGYVLYSSGVAGKALGWLGKKFGTLADDAVGAYQGISDALAAGDIGMAANILWLTLKMEWKRGVAALLSVWLTFKHGFLKLVYDTWHGALALGEFIWHGLQVGWIEVTSAISQTWTRFTSFFADKWEYMKAIAKKAWTWIKSLFDDSVDTDAAYKKIDAEREAAVSGIDDAKQKALRARELQRARQREAEAQRHEDRQIEIVRSSMAEREAMEKERRERMAGAEQELVDARAEWQEALNQAAAARQKKEAEDDGPGQLEGADKLKDIMSRISGGMEVVERKVNIRGTFNVAALSGFASGSVAERTAVAAEQTAKNTKDVKRILADFGGSRFV